MNCVLDVVLQPVDVLYLPRGAVHEVRCDKGDSLHVTISFCQRWTWADLLLGSFQKVVLETAALYKRLRESVPLRFGRCADAGVDNGPMGEHFGKPVRRMAEQVARNYPVHYAFDKMTERFFKGILPMRASVLRNSGGKNVAPGCHVRLVASAYVRLVVGDNGLPELVTRHTSQSCLPEKAGSIKYIVDRYPDGVKMEDIPLEKMEEGFQLARGLVEMGVLRVVCSISQQSFVSRIVNGDICFVDPLSVLGSIVIGARNS